MPIQNKINSQKIFLDYKPAELHKSKEWRVVFYAKIPATNQFKIFRKRVPPISSKREREKYARKMVASINQKLENGWSPFLEENNIRYKSVEFCASLFLEHQQKEVDDKIKRPDTLRAYKSTLNIFLKFVRKFPKLLKLDEIVFFAFPLWREKNRFSALKLRAISKIFQIIFFSKYTLPNKKNS